MDVFSQDKAKEKGTGIGVFKFLFIILIGIRIRIGVRIRLPIILLKEEVQEEEEEEEEGIIKKGEEDLLEKEGLKRFKLLISIRIWVGIAIPRKEKVVKENQKKQEAK